LRTRKASHPVSSLQSPRALEDGFGTRVALKSHFTKTARNTHSDL